MNNIEKFEKLKELSALKAELHKKELIEKLTLSNSEDSIFSNIDKAIALGHRGYAIYRQLQPLLTNN